MCEFTGSRVCVCLHIYEYIHSSSEVEPGCVPGTTIIEQNIKTILIAGVPSSQALPGLLITAPPSVCVPAVLGALPVWIQNPKKMT